MIVQPVLEVTTFSIPAHTKVGYFIKPNMYTSDTLFDVSMHDNAYGHVYSPEV